MTTFNAERLLQRLRELQGSSVPRRYLVAFSGGLDSTVLLHALAQTFDRHQVAIAAVHIDHGLHPDSTLWERHCRRVAERLGAGYSTQRVAIAQEDPGGPGLEAAAREARYGAFRGLMQEGDALLSAHHQEDQAETVLLNLLRGSGLAGLAGIRAAQPFASGVLLRPLLGISRRDLEQYAAECGVEWLEDPSNADARFDRNFLRQEILPRLTARWPAAARRLQRSAELAAEAAELQDALAALDLAALGTAGCLDIGALERLSPARQRNVLRYAIRMMGLPPPPSTRLQQAIAELMPAREDRKPLVRWRGAELRRYRGKVYVLPAMDVRACPRTPTLTPERELWLGPELGRLRLEAGIANGLDPQVVAQGLVVRFRAGGEKIRPAGGSRTRSLKKLLQERGVVPWMRDRLPLLYAGERLVAVADLWIAAGAVGERGYGLRWTEHPAIF